ncbi:hypothetical protein ACFX2I_014444 [Malus domestica]
MARAMLAPERPRERKNSSFGKRIFSGSAKSSLGTLLTSLEISELANPWSLRRPRTKYGLSVVSKLTFSDNVRAFSAENPHELTRYNTVIEPSHSCASSNPDSNNGSDDNDLLKCGGL